MRDQHQHGRVAHAAPSAEVEPCQTCDGEGQVEINRHGHTAACPDCTVAVEDEYGRTLWHERSVA